jgi:hypothetical protein
MENNSVILDKSMLDHSVSNQDLRHGEFNREESHQVLENISDQYDQNDFENHGGVDDL